MSKKAGGLHEDFSRENAERTSSDRTFGFVFSGVFTVVGLLPLVHHDGVQIWALAVAAVFLIVALVRPILLHPLNVAWMKLGLLLHRIVSPIVMALLFFGVVTPIALVARVLGKDPLRLKLDASAKTYWIERSPPGPSPNSIRNQF